MSECAHVFRTALPREQGALHSSAPHHGCARVELLVYLDVLVQASQHPAVMNPDFELCEPSAACQSRA